MRRGWPRQGRQWPIPSASSDEPVNVDNVCGHARASEARPRGELAEQGAVRAAGAAGAAPSPIFFLGNGGGGDRWRAGGGYRRR
jgi:hypothetical protein